MAIAEKLSEEITLTSHPEIPDSYPDDLGIHPFSEYEDSGLCRRCGQPITNMGHPEAWDPNNPVEGYFP